MALLVGLLAGCDWVKSRADDLNRWAKGRASEINYRKGVVKITIADQDFDVPVRYMYGEAIEKRGHWPKPKDHRVEVGALSLSVLLPDMRPHRLEDDAK